MRPGNPAGGLEISFIVSLGLAFLGFPCLFSAPYFSSSTAFLTTCLFSAPYFSSSTAFLTTYGF